MSFILPVQKMISEKLTLCLCVQGLNNVLLGHPGKIGFPQEQVTIHAHLLKKSILKPWANKMVES